MFLKLSFYEDNGPIDTNVTKNGTFVLYVTSSRRNNLCIFPNWPTQSMQWTKLLKAVKQFQCQAAWDTLRDIT